MWELDNKKSWEPKNWCFRTVVLEKTLESPLDCKKIKPVTPKGNQPWIFIGRTDDNAEGPILWPLDGKIWLIGKDFDAGEDWRQEEKGMSEDEMVGWHHQLKGHEFEQALGDGEGQGILVCCSPWGCKELDMTEWLNNNKETLWACTAVLDSATPWTVAGQAPLPIEFFRQEYWTEVSFSTVWDLPNPGMKPTSPALVGRFFYHWAT